MRIEVRMGKVFFELIYINENRSKQGLGGLWIIYINENRNKEGLGVLWINLYQ